MFVIASFLSTIYALCFMRDFWKNSFKDCFLNSTGGFSYQRIMYWRAVIAIPTYAASRRLAFAHGADSFVAHMLLKTSGRNCSLVSALFVLRSASTARLTGIPFLNHSAMACCVQSNSRAASRSEEHTSELQSPCNLVCRLL